MRANIFYILVAAGLLSACSDCIDNAETFLNGSAKTPIAVRTSIATGAVSRAFDKTFEPGDKLYAYIEAGILDGDVFTPVEIFTWANNFTFTGTSNLNSDDAAGAGNITSTDLLSPTIYWDDFSSTDYDLREDGRGIRLKYGYCYNGGEANATNNTTTEQIKAGTLTWTIPADQSTADAVKKSDLLFAKTQKMQTYTHEDDDTRGSLTLPYTHAMSKLTIIVTTGETFASDKENFASAVLTLKGMQQKCAVDAPAGTVDAVAEGTHDITTYNSNKENTTATYQAIIGPTNLSAGNILAHITNIDGNAYDIPVTEGILSAWSSESKLELSTEEIQNGVAQSKSRTGIPHGQGYTTKPGIHYILNVTVDKQKIIIRATITDWENVTASGKTAIQFTDDVTEKGDIADDLKAHGFDVYKKSHDMINFLTSRSTKVTFADGKWSYSPVIYWGGQNDASQFRAVSPADRDDHTLNQGVDLLWGTSGTADINPRTGDVPLNFKHLMSKLCIKLQTTEGASAVDLTNATIKITNLATDGTLSLADGTVTAGTPTSVMIESKPSGFTEYVIPQTIGDTADLIVTLNDGTTYKLQLNRCTKDSDNTIPYLTTWAPGETYTYTIHLSKEEITFRAVVKAWEDATGVGNATLDWDYED